MEGRERERKKEGRERKKGKKWKKRDIIVLHEILESLVIFQFKKRNFSDKGFHFVHLIAIKRDEGNGKEESITNYQSEMR